MFHAQACLEHRHSYVRKNAALAVLNIHHNFGSDLLPDGPELIDKFIRVCSPSSPLLINIFAARLPPDKHSCTCFVYPGDNQWAVAESGGPINGKRVCASF